MTVGTNALLEERGARTALVATGASPTCWTSAARNRPSLYHPCRGRPRSLVEPERSVRGGGADRPDGRVEELNEGEIERLVDELRGGDVESIAVCLLFAFRGSGSRAPPRHRPARGASRRARLGLARGPAGLPRVRALLDDRHRRLPLPPARPLPDRTGGRLPRARASPEPRGDALVRRHCRGRRGGPRRRLERALGPRRGRGRRRAAGAGGGQPRRDRDRHGRHLVRRLRGGRRARSDATDSREIDGRPVQLPMVDVHTVGAGGGSIGWRDAGGALRVGPRSAGAEPGPACYGRGGSEPTVTDANLLLGYLSPDSSWRAGSSWTRRRRGEAIASLGEELGLDADRDGGGDRPGGEPGDDPRAPGDDRRAGRRSRATTRCCPSAARGRCTPRRLPESSRSRGSSAPAPAACSPRSG